MQQRQLRLGDLLDDYCPRERRLTNHAVVAMVEDRVKQTRCTTCDTEHEYKGGKTPARRKKEAQGALYNQVLNARRKEEGPSTSDAPIESTEKSPADEPTPVVGTLRPVPGSSPEPLQPLQAASSPTPEPAPVSEEREARPADGSVHRRLIRATLPKVEGQVPLARPITEFTMRRTNARPNAFRGKNFRAPMGGMNGGSGRGPMTGRSGGDGSAQGRGGRGPGGSSFHAKGGGHGPAPRGHGRPQSGHSTGRKKFSK